MPPLFFGPSTQPLYGVLEAPGARSRKTGVLLFYPGLQEYSRAHWAFRTLATALAGQGFPVLRFDYRGMGDSAGEPDAATVEAWTDDACVAAGELRDSTGVQHVALIGMRLGAAIALHAGERLSFVRRIFLWDPVVTGRAYLGELEQMDRAMRLRELHPLHRPDGELAGFRVPAPVRQSLERLDLREGGAGAARVAALFSQAVTPEIAALRDALTARAYAVQTHAISGSEGPPFPDAPLLVPGAISTLVARMVESEP